jgi:hypothetical protein
MKHFKSVLLSALVLLPFIGALLQSNLARMNPLTRFRQQKRHCGDLMMTAQCQWSGPVPYSQLCIGVVKESAMNEHRVAQSPESLSMLVKVLLVVAARRLSISLFF